MSLGSILVDLHQRIFGIDGQGNLVLNGNLATEQANRAGPAGIVGQGIPTGVTYSTAKGSANVCLVSYQLVDCYGNPVASSFSFDAFLSDAATGLGLTATTASGAVAAGASGAVLGILTASKAFRVQTTATGLFILSITDSAKTGFYPVAQLPGRQPIVAPQLVAASYG